MYLRFILITMVLAAAACSQQPETAGRGRSLSTDAVWLRLHTDAPGKLRTAIEREGLDVTGSSHRHRFVDVYLPRARRDRLLARHGARIRYTEELARRAPEALSDYHDPQEVATFLDQVEASHPGIARKFVLEDTLFEGQVIHAMKISDNVELDEDEPTYMMECQIHAREVMTAEVCIDAIEQLTSRYGSDAQVDRWVDEMEIWIVPVVNPDGAAYMHTSDDMWRKNRHPDCAVDNNRNFSWSWDACNGSSDQCYDDTYHGTGPASEPENQAIEALLEQVRPMYFIDYHSYGEYIVWPGSCGQVEENDLFSLVGSELNDRVECDDGQTGGWTIGNSADVMYPADGAGDDQAYGGAGAISFTFELNSGWDNFHPDYDTWRDATVTRQRAAWGYLLDRTLDGPSVRGLVYDADSLAPVAATYQFANHPFESGQEPLRCDANGRFGRAVLPDSDHVVVFTAPGYLPESRTLHVASGPVDLDVPLVAGTNHAPTASAGTDQTVNEGDTVHLDATASSDPDGSTLFFVWSQTAGPTVHLRDAYSSQPSFFAPSVDGDTQLIFELVASDGELSSSPDTVGVTVRDIWNETSVYPSSDTPVGIPDNDPTGAESVIHVDEDRLILKAAVELHITHTWIGDLRITLTSPAGTLVVLHDHEGGSQHDLHASYEPAEFTGEMSGGDWVLRMVDGGPSDVGTLDSWTLSLDLVGEPPCTTAADCDLPNVSVHACVDGRCEIASCDPDFADCNTLAHDGCEIDTATDPLHCGGCDNACSYPNANALCVDGTCQMGTCHGNYHDCNASPADGCEANLGTDPDNCGSCGTVCSFAHATGACAAGSCTIGSCDDLWGDCDGQTANGCEAPLDSDLDNCGACGQACQLAHADATCDGGACRVVGCDAGWGDCDQMDATGCETDLDTDPAHCGACAHACSFDHADGVCQAGACRMGACEPGYGDCNTDEADGCEADLRSDPSHCGSCDHACSYPHASAACYAGGCRLDACDPGYDDCNGQSADGCEADVHTDPDNCGACGQSCALPHAEAGCQDGACTVGDCEEPFGDCNHDADDGCETYLNNNPDHCGACDVSCDLAHATANCRTGACVIESCDDGYANCNRETDDGCEVELATDNQHCGGCNRPCEFDHAAGTCQEGACLMGVCDAGYADCNTSDADGCEVDVTTDEDHCGGCDQSCPQDHTCEDGTCRAPCPDADGDGFADQSCGGEDCNDADDTVHPGAAEACNQIDDDCDGQTDEEPTCQEDDGGGGCGCNAAGAPGSRFVWLLMLLGTLVIGRARRT